MHVREYYASLSAAREQLWNFVRALPSEELDRNVIPTGKRFHNIKDLLLHMIDVEDHWIHNIGRNDGLSSDQYQHNWITPAAEQFELGWILEYGHKVTERTRAFLASNPDLDCTVKMIQDDPDSDLATLDQLMWHVMTHEVRHTAQVALLIRQMGHNPPWLDYMRFVRPSQCQTIKPTQD